MRGKVCIICVFVNDGKLSRSVLVLIVIDKYLFTRTDVLRAIQQGVILLFAGPFVSTALN